MPNVARYQYSHRGFKLSYLDSAPDDSSRPVVLLLHGFPDTAEMWQPVIESLHAAGYRCIAPDMLGCGESEMAPRVRDYHARLVASDHIALLDHLGINKAYVVGHDLGAVAAWFMAAYFSQRVERMVVMTVGHPTSYGRAGLKQKLIGWYTVFFQLGGFVEWFLRGDGFFSLRNVFRSHPQMDEVVQRMRQKGRLTAALRFYRAAFLPVLFTRQPNVSVPTLGIWADGDRFLTEAQMLGSEKYMDGPWRYERLHGHHWMPIEQPQRVASLVCDHIERE